MEKAKEVILQHLVTLSLSLLVFIRIVERQLGLIMLQSANDHAQIHDIVRTCLSHDSFSFNMIHCDIN